MDPFVQTDRLALRRFTAQDADLLIELDSGPAVMRFLTGGQPTEPAAAVRERVPPRVLATYDMWDGRFGLFAAYATDSGAFIGWFQLRPEPGGPPDEIELGYRLRQDAWGNGYATEGSRALLGKALSELDVRVVCGATLSVNVASQKVMERAGMTVAEALPLQRTCSWSRALNPAASRYGITREQWEQR
ncbi:MAG: GCN5-related N-acetyltransferase [Frankiales bacterium]|nr:GCN5-related N-acetyltransferase [Frankiales bacterium]